jgi:hypothetical protein
MVADFETLTPSPSPEKRERGGTARKKVGRSCSPSFPHPLSSKRGEGRRARKRVGRGCSPLFLNPAPLQERGGEEGEEES